MNVSEKFGVPRLVGAVCGLELEVEGTNLPTEVEGWHVVRDGSLRDGLEYVTRTPAGSVKLKAELEAVAAAFKDNGTRPNYSFRTSTHCHVNVSNLPLEQVKAIIYLYYLFEQQYVGFCAKNRNGNRFCLRLIDAEGILNQVKKFFDSDRLPTNDTGKYCALNIVPIGRQGTLEFRCLEGTDDWAKIHLWVRALIRLRKVGRELGTVKAIQEKSIEELGELLFNTPMLRNGFLKAGWEADVVYQQSLMLPLQG